MQGLATVRWHGAKVSVVLSSRFSIPQLSVRGPRAGPSGPCLGKSSNPNRKRRNIIAAQNYRRLGSPAWSFQALFSPVLISSAVTNDPRCLPAAGRTPYAVACAQGPTQKPWSIVSNVKTGRFLWSVESSGITQHLVKCLENETGQSSFPWMCEVKQ